MMMVDMEEEDGYVYKGRAVAVEVVIHERSEHLCIFRLVLIIIEILITFVI